MEDLIVKTYKFEVLTSKSMFVDADGRPSRTVAELTPQQASNLKTDIERELYDEFDMELASIEVDMDNMIVKLFLNEITPLHTSWELFAFRKKGVQITAHYYIRLVETL